MKKLRNEKGFTLVELMIVVAIIGILAAIAVPKFNASRINAYNASALSDLKNVATAQANLNATTQKFGVSFQGDVNKLNCEDGGYESAGGELVTGGNTAYVPMLCTVSNANNPQGDMMSLSNGVSALVDTDTPPDEGAETAITWVAVTKHGNGDSCFAMDDDSTNIYIKKTPAKGAGCAPGEVLAAELDGVTIPPTVSAVDIQTGTNATDWQVK
ncbi:MAG TPA: hypothetical protein DEB25_02760 [Desulfobulbaceae bacterium]|nr:hypothetical protein [Desulfobulbaceae bacterium]